jgi:hypothetical protein
MPVIPATWEVEVGRSQSEALEKLDPIRKIKKKGLWA